MPWLEKCKSALLCRNYPRQAKPGAGNSVSNRLFFLIDDFGIDDGAFFLAARFGLRPATGLFAGGLTLPFFGPGLLAGRFVKFSRNRLPDFVEFFAR